MSNIRYLNQSSPFWEWVASMAPPANAAEDGHEQDPSARGFDPWQHLEENGPWGMPFAHRPPPAQQGTPRPAPPPGHESSLAQPNDDEDPPISEPCPQCDGSEHPARHAAPPHPPHGFGRHGPPGGFHGPHGLHGPHGPHGAHGPHGPHGHGHGPHGLHGPHGPHGPGSHGHGPGGRRGGRGGRGGRGFGGGRGRFGGPHRGHFGPETGPNSFEALGSLFGVRAGQFDMNNLRGIIQAGVTAATAAASAAAQGRPTADASRDVMADANADLYGGDNETVQAQLAAIEKASRKDDDMDFTPPVDVYDLPTSYVVHVSLPGAQKSDVSLNWDAEASALNISGCIARSGDEEMMHALALDERDVGVFARKVNLGREVHVESDAISARMENGVLLVTVPKVEDFEEVKKVDIE